MTACSLFCRREIVRTMEQSFVRGSVLQEVYKKILEDEKNCSKCAVLEFMQRMKAVGGGPSQSKIFGPARTECLGESDNIDSNEWIIRTDKRGSMSNNTVFGLDLNKMVPRQRS